jgi:hypothetical protein
LISSKTRHEPEGTIMTNEWIIDVLADLKSYAIRHHYMSLAEQLDDALVTAAAELMQEAEAMQIIELAAMPARRSPLIAAISGMAAPRHLVAAP